MRKLLLAALAASFTVPASAAEYLISFGASDFPDRGPFVEAPVQSVTFGATIDLNRSSNTNPTTAGVSNVSFTLPGTVYYSYDAANDTMWLGNTLAGAADAISIGVQDGYWAFVIDGAFSANPFTIFWQGTEMSPDIGGGIFEHRARNSWFSIRDRYPAAVPEPATWAMMLFGFGALGAAMRFRPRHAAVSI